MRCHLAEEHGLCRNIDPKEKQCSRGLLLGKKPFSLQRRCKEQDNPEQRCGKTDIHRPPRKRHTHERDHRECEHPHRDIARTVAYAVTQFLSSNVQNYR